MKALAIVLVLVAIGAYLVIANTTNYRTRVQDEESRRVAHEQLFERQTIAIERIAWVLTKLKEE